MRSNGGHILPAWPSPKCWANADKRCAFCSIEDVDALRLKEHRRSVEKLPNSASALAFSHASIGCVRRSPKVSGVAVPLQTVSTRRVVLGWWVYITCASPRRKDARRPNIPSRIRTPSPDKAKQNDPARLVRAVLLGSRNARPFSPK